MKAIVVEKYGGAAELQYQEKPIPVPRPHSALVRLYAIGVNYIDIYHRTGLYPQVLPFTPGLEAAGVVEALGEGVSLCKVGDRVAFASAIGSYAEYNVVPEEQLVPLPDSVSFEQAAALMLQGLTAHYLVTSTYAVQPGETVLIHAAAGGVGLLLTQLAKLRGARVIGTVSTEAKAALAREAGADEVIIYTTQDFVAETRRLTEREGVSVVYDSVGADTFEGSLSVLKPRGMLVSFGNASGVVPPVSPLLLSQKGSLFLTRPSLTHYIATRQELLMRARDLFTWLEQGTLRLYISQKLSLCAAKDAHQLLESRRTTGKLLLIPE
ncbi:MAG: quinone oxidoreductase [Chloroherpetonaceae bacterium]|nr:quinone oxidoreductase [Chloroherpetonaceae bacterium]MCS7211641.1 quinone oxidoreductase [Chloroherpetonaceae bacterium]MDW8019976.1 quinone oxidoreductase [Chloroherpetonaceae bacterium]MDW8467537.1 quinone oxidoreductase [Chloroherpetonaceae bacterium]